MDKEIAKVHETELDQYEKLLNTDFAVTNNNRPFSDYTFLCEIHIKNGLHLGSDHLGRNACFKFIKTISEVLHNDIIDANHYDFSVIVTNFGPKLRCYGQQSTCYGFPIIAGPESFPI